MTPDQLYALLPSVHRRLDAQNGGQLYALLSVIAEQADIVQDDIKQLYDNWFIETCEDWVVPYLGDLVGYSLPPGAAAALSACESPTRGLLAAVAPRREVADCIANRRRKGTLPLLEDLAADVADWPSRAVEYRRLLAVTQPIRRYSAQDQEMRRRQNHGRLADLRRADILDRIDGPFDELARTVEVARPGSGRAGRYNIPSVGLHVWRLRIHRVTRAPALCLDAARSRYSISLLGNDTRLFTRPVPEPSASHVADEMNVPAPIRRRAFTERMHDYYGPLKSVCLWTETDAGHDAVAIDRIVSADLSGWAYRPRPGQVALDPVLGRIAFSERTAPQQGVRVTYHHAFAGDFGGGEYPRLQTASDGPDAAHYRVGPREEQHRITDAIKRWRTEKASGHAGAEAIVEITGTDVYEDLTSIPLGPGDNLTLRAADGARPVLRMDDWSADRPESLRVTGTARGEGPPPRLVLDGLTLTGRSVQVCGAVGHLTIRHCTLLPGRGLDARCLPQAPGAPALELVHTSVRVRVEHSILGSILVLQDESATEPNRLDLSDTVLDATHRETAALTGPQGRHAHAVLTARRTTVIGSVHTRAVDLLENCLLDGEVQVLRRAEGQVRFCWLPPGSSTPRRFHCEPEHSGAPDRVRLRFASTRYGTPDYARLADTCADEIRRGAGDGSEPGAMHHLFSPQREDNLRTRLTEYIPAGCDAGVFFAT
ncbi:hypothetical protein [Streptomyces sp. NPDC002265]|uniref:hypothetical protein n=1 Tax=Streptomyces sp. NPDC002265 TaxID=3154415 RepID=UPI00331B3660